MKKRFKMTDNMKKNLLEWWIIGAIYFFIGFGSFAAHTDAIDLIFFLGITIGIVKTYIMPKFIDEINPYKKKSKSSVFRLANNIIKGMLLSLMVIYMYDNLNLFLIKVLKLQAGQVVVYPEPILFGIFYITIEKSVKKIFNKIKGEIK